MSMVIPSCVGALGFVVGLLTVQRSHKTVGWTRDHPRALDQPAVLLLYWNPSIVSLSGVTDGWHGWRQPRSFWSDAWQVYKGFSYNSQSLSGVSIPGWGYYEPIRGLGGSGHDSFASLIAALVLGTPGPAGVGVVRGDLLIPMPGRRLGRLCTVREQEARKFMFTFQHRKKNIKYNLPRFVKLDAGDALRNEYWDMNPMHRCTGPLLSWKHYERAPHRNPGRYPGHSKF